MKATIAKAYKTQSLPVPRGITAHSTRSVATSAAWATQAPIAEICRVATWVSPSPFIRHHKIDVFASADASFGRRVLQRVHSDTRGDPTQTETLPQYKPSLGMSHFLDAWSSSRQGCIR
uniref:Uncharacterized protein n=1 Tax=Micrurus lemniscatus lemniscatus TaxID=129467 RepID=A0A2D4JA42_MICLE